MYRVLIVDDEEPVLDGYAFLIQTRSQDFSLAGKARSGTEAITLTRELKPDVVFMDIRMPGMDGLEAIAELHKEFPRTVFILSTAYERFDLAQKAIPLGVFAYLVKPVSKKSFLETLDSAKESLDLRSLPATGQSIDDVARRFIRESIWKEMTEDAWQAYKRSLGLASDKGLVCLLELDEGHGQLAKDILAKLGFHYHCVSATRLTLEVIFVNGDADPAAFKAELSRILAETVPSGAFCSYAVGSPHPGREAYLSAVEAQGELDRQRDFSALRFRERLRTIEIRRRIGLSDEAGGLVLFEGHWHELFAAYGFSVAKAKMVSLFTLLVDDYLQRSGQADADPPLSPAEEIMPLADIDEWAEWARAAYVKLSRLFAARREGNFPRPLELAIAFIEEHYAEQIQLPQVAEAAHVSGAHLSRLFSEYLSTNFVDYLTLHRIELAERLLRDTRQNVKEIAYAVGYQDPNYFSKIFRKCTGMQPSAFAARERGES
jgi:two-component system response regulator YesN